MSYQEGNGNEIDVKLPPIDEYARGNVKLRNNQVYNLDPDTTDMTIKLRFYREFMQNNLQLQFKYQFTQH